ncbi:ORF201 [Saltwater crocodilepox virus]|nr:ORF201 [Saltwater crocodilepox virus]QGT48782.1 ORF201 [Saltwater crocodilepox virus]QGT48994.1 ORF201 [Saltwater crocodilepox virus]QGT49208.1 ORF201 [Saltwater crocodilepox virus]
MWSKARSADRGPLTSGATATLRRAAAEAAARFCAKGRSLFASISRLPRIAEDQEESVLPLRRSLSDWSQVRELSDRCSASAYVTICLETWGDGEMVLDARAVEPVARHLARWLLSQTSRRLTVRSPKCRGVDLAVFVDVVVDRVDSPLPPAAGDKRAFDCWTLPRATRPCAEVRFRNVVVTRCGQTGRPRRDSADSAIVENKASIIGSVLEPAKRAVDADGGAGESPRRRNRSVSRIVFFYGVR